jgi:imidazolonepropionase-like amidohydrolase
MTDSPSFRPPALLRAILVAMALGLLAGLAGAIVVLLSGPREARAHAAPQAADSVYAFENVSVVPMDGDRVLARRTVIVRGGRIATIGAAASVRVPAGAVRIDGRGKYLMPGLIDMHAHLAQGDGSIGTPMGRLLALDLANGITTARSMGTPPATVVPALEIRERLARGDLLGPRLVVYAPSINGQNTQGAADAMAKVLAAKEAGYDGIKIHGNLGREAYDSLVAAAKRAGLPVAGHVTGDVGLMHAARAGQQLEHLDGWIPAILPPDLAAAPAAQGQVVVEEAILAKVDESRIPVVAGELKRLDAWAGPTLSLFEIIVSDEPAATLAARPEMRYAPRPAIAAWSSQRTQQLAGAPPLAGRQRWLGLRRKIAKTLADSGVGLLAGSDSPQFFSVPGFALHRELGHLAAAGLTPFQALSAATSGAARHLGLRDVGTVAEGRRADLLLLDANPLADVSATARPAGVMLAGRWLPRAQLDSLLAEVEKSAAAVQ